MRLLLVLVVCLIALSGCGSTSNKGELQTINKNLRQELAAAQGEIGQLQGRNTLLKQEVENLKQVAAVLNTEKSSRVKESSVLRGQVRKFVQDQVDGLKQFLVAGNLLDYVGGELVERASIDEKPLTVVDLTNRIPSNGVLTGVGAFVIKPTQVKVKVLRNINNNLVTVWESNLIDLLITGPNRHQFANTVGVEKGDVLAYEFPKNVGVGFDSGTGDSRHIEGKLNLGQSVQTKSLLGAKERRSYAMGVYGLLNQ